MKIVSEFEYISINTSSLVEYSMSGVYSNKIGNINFLNKKISSNSDPNQFHEITLSLKKVSIIFPNIIITNDDYLINTNNGHTSTEKIDHNIKSFPLSVQNNNLIIEKPSKCFNVNECVYITARKNYAAFLFGEIPRINKYINFIKSGMPIILHGTCLDFHIKFFEFLGIESKQIIVVPEDTLIFALNLYHSTPTFFHHTISYSAIDYLQKKFKTNFDESFNKNIYLSRSKLGKNSDRFIFNEKKLETFLKKKGFSILYPEKTSLINQIKIFNSAKIIVSPFGATWANSIFRKEKSISLMLATKFLPEFTKNFQYLGNDLSILT